MREKREKIRSLLVKYYLTYAWLINELEKQGVSLANTELSDILNDRRRGEKSVKVIEKSVEILEKYGEYYGST